MVSPPARGGEEEGLPTIRLVALDLDGTILESGTAISGQVLDLLRALRERKVACVTASGRPHDFQVDLLERHGAGPETGLFQALIADERELYLLDGDPARRFRPHREWNDRVHGRWLPLAGEAMRWLALARGEASRRGWRARVDVSEEEVVRRGLATLVMERPEEAAAICGWLSERLSSVDCGLACNRNVLQVQVYDAAAGKGPALAALATLLGLVPGQVLAIGDSVNDESMLDGRLGFLAATVANADDEVKAVVRRRGGYVARAPLGAGVIEVLQPLVG